MVRLSIAAACCLASAFWFGCGSDGPAIAENDSGASGSGGIGTLEAGPESDAGADARDDAPSSADGDASADADADAGTWVGTGDACDADTDCPPGWRWCIRGFCGVYACNGTEDPGCIGAISPNGHKCINEERTPGSPQSTLTMCETRR